MHRLLLLSALFTLACTAGTATPGDGTTPHAETPTGDTVIRAIEVMRSGAFPPALERFLADTSRAGGSPRVEANWGATPRRFAVVAWHEDPRGFFVSRLSVSEVAGDSATVIAIGDGQGDAHWDEVRAFQDGARTLLLGEVEDEYSLGLTALSVDSVGRITDLGLPSVSLPDSSEGSMGPSKSALAVAAVSVVAGRWRVEFGEDLIRDPGSNKQILLCRVDLAKPIVIQQAEDGWRVENARQQDAGDPRGPLRSCPTQQSPRP